MLAKPELGACTWTFGNLPLVEIARRVRALALDGVELLGEPEQYAAEGLSVADVGRVLADHGLDLFSITPPNVDIAHPDTAVRQQAVDTYRRLLDFAAELGDPLVSCHGFVGRVRPLSTLEEEMTLLDTAVRQIAEHAQTLGLRLAFEVLNRYESHLINSGAEALAFVEQVGAGNLGVLLDAYHMNIEEQNPAEALRQAGGRLWLYHMADSNRQAVGRGHIKFGEHLWALDDIGYQGPIIFECTAPGPDPFTPVKDEKSLAWLETYLRESRAWF
ncbi:MAG: sugar phosphate isomerase/epimerase family protein [Anaerolineae bacterium]